MNQRYHICASFIRGKQERVFAYTDAFAFSEYRKKCKQALRSRKGGCTIRLREYCLEGVWETLSEFDIY